MAKESVRHRLNEAAPLVIASHNAGKVREFQDLLLPLHIPVRSAAEISLEEPEETGDSFEANAVLKARAAALASGMRALADDSGLVVPALDGAPGIYSARWAGPTKDFTFACTRVAQALQERGENPCGAAAYFVCALALAQPDGSCITLRGEVHGTLTFPARGSHGFGYDPIFIPTGYTQTFGEMSPQQKHAISHRAQAFSALLAHLDREDGNAQTR